jgi:glutathione S-transferase
MYTLYSMQRSGNSYKVRLALARLGVPYNLVEVDILKGESRTPEFLAKNPNGQVPLLEVGPDRHLAESNAILWYVAGGSTLAPEDRITRAEALQWMFFEQHSIEPNIGAAYFWLALIKGGRELQSHALEDWMENGYRALGVMETHLTRHRFFVADHFTIADIALYAYTHVANQCDFDLSRFPAIRAWLSTALKTPRFVTGSAPMGPNRCRVPALSGHHCSREPFQVDHAQAHSVCRLYVPGRTHPRHRTPDYGLCRACGDHWPCALRSGGSDRRLDRGRAGRRRGQCHRQRKRTVCDSTPARPSVHRNGWPDRAFTAASQA